VVDDTRSELFERLYAAVSGKSRPGLTGGAGGWFEGYVWRGLDGGLLAETSLEDLE